ncbi:MAG: hypothetical protein JWL82_487 [Parcubacteria group bacterium]|nr:hypothetical protein [Parcubacteria group bacterium]
MKTGIIITVLGVVLILGGIFYFSSGALPKGSLESVVSTEAPWPAETEHLRDRLVAINLPALAAEGQALHIHQHLDIYVHGVLVQVPSEIGIHTAAPAFISPIHVHDTSNIVHVESPIVKEFTLGEFFNIWGVRLSPTCIGGYCTDATSTMNVYVNGVRYEGDPTALKLESHQEIVITYGTDAELPKPIPSSFTFPEGY